MKQWVTVWGEQVEINVSQKSRSVWIASGDYLGYSITVQDRSKGSAAKRWAEAARYKTN